MWPSDTIVLFWSLLGHQVVNGKTVLLAALLSLGGLPGVAGLREVLDGIRFILSFHLVWFIGQ